MFSTHHRDKCNDDFGYWYPRFSCTKSIASSDQLNWSWSQKSHVPGDIVISFVKSVIGIVIAATKQELTIMWAEDPNLKINL
jgi:hypothetical protein